MREQAHAALLTREVESVTRRAEAFIAEHRSFASASSNAASQAESRSGEEGRQQEDDSAGPGVMPVGSEVGAGVDAAAVAQGAENAGNGRIDGSQASARNEMRPRWASREEEVAARLAEIERVRARLRVVERERDQELAAQRMEQERLQRMRRDAEIFALVQTDEELETSWGSQRDEEIMRQDEPLRAASAAECESSESGEELAGGRDTGTEDGQSAVSDMQGELETMRAEHARLLARRDAEVESVAAVEAR
jgi:hypothetical protein